MSTRKFAAVAAGLTLALSWLVYRAVERPMLEVVMRQAQGNQLRASEMLGINRNTLRKKLQQHGML